MPAGPPPTMQHWWWIESASVESPIVAISQVNFPACRGDDHGFCTARGLQVVRHISQQSFHELQSRFYF